MNDTVDLEPETVLAGRFVIEKRLETARGCSTYRARDLQLETDVAVAVFVDHPTGVDTDDHFRALIQRAREITHPGVRRIYDLFWHHGEGWSVPFVTMQLIEGHTLETYAAGRPLGAGEVLSIARQIAEALDVLHAAGIVLHELSPGGVMIEPRPEGPRVVLTVHDSAAVAEKRGHGAEKNVNGSSMWTAPEQRRNEPATTHSNVYSFGLVLQWLTRLREPTRRLEHLRSGGARAIASRRRWRIAIATALEEDPRRRPSSARAVIAMIDQERSRPRIRLASAGAGIAVSAILLMSLFLPRGTANVPPWTPEPERGLVDATSTESTWLLITELDNRTGHPLLEGSLESALAWQLRQFPTLNAASPERILDGLRLIGKPPDTTIDSVVAAEIARYDDGIDFIVTGTIEDSGSGYRLRIDAIDPRTGKIVNGWERDAREPEELLRAVRKISREMVGRPEPSDNSKLVSGLIELETPTLRSFQLFSRVERLMADRPLSEAEHLLRDIVDADPKLAMAWILLAWSIRDGGGDPEVVLPIAGRAIDLGRPARVIDRDRLFIQASWLYLNGNLERSASVYTNLLRQYPDHRPSVERLLEILSEQPALRPGAVEAIVRYAETRPNHLESNLLAATALTDWSSEPERARAFLGRAGLIRTMLQEKSEDASRPPVGRHPTLAEIIPSKP